MKVHIVYESKYGNGKKCVEYLQEAITKTLSFLTGKGFCYCPFHISIQSDISAAKMGLGSSSAVVVAVVKAILRLYGVDVSDKIGIAKRVVRMVPMGVVKG